jgi:hypothetical protein
MYEGTSQIKKPSFGDGFFICVISLAKAHSGTSPRPLVECYTMLLLDSECSGLLITVAIATPSYDTRLKSVVEL